MAVLNGGRHVGFFTGDHSVDGRLAAGLGIAGADVFVGDAMLNRRDHDGARQGLRQDDQPLSAAASGGGGGIINASFGSGGMSGGGWNGNPLAVAGGFGGAGWSKSGSTRPEVAAYIKAQAARLGIDPNVALRVAQSEGLNTYVGDYGTSFGAFQLHYGGSGIRGMNSGGLGDRFTRETGLNARDPATWKAQVEYALKTAKREGWGAWHGAAHVGIGNRQGLDWRGKIPDEHPALSAAPLPPRRPSGGHDAPATHATTAKLDRVTEKLEQVASAVEWGGLHRLHITADKSLKVANTYSRGGAVTRRREADRFQ